MKSGVWCRTINHESQHFIVDGEAACKTAKVERWASWALVPKDELDESKQCCRCKHHAQKATASSDDALSKFREWGRIGGMKGGKSVSLAKRRAALKNGRCRKAKPPLASRKMSC